MTRLIALGLVALLSPSTLFLRACFAADDAAYRAALARAVRAAAEQVLPSVVAIEVIGTSGGATGEVASDAPTSGVIVDADGYVLASSIVAERTSASILVVLPDNTRHSAKVVSRDHHRDLVLLKIKTDKPLEPIDLSGQPDLVIGSTTIAVGRYGDGVSPMVSRGVLSATGRLNGIALQTDARVSAALYGGPLVDLYGNVLGIMIPAVAPGAGESSTDWYDSGVAFAIPGDVIAKKLDRLKAGEDINRGLIGIVAKSADSLDSGTEIAAVRIRSPAEAAGIKAGDEVIAIDGSPVRRYIEIRQVLGGFDAGEVITLKLRRGDVELDVEVTLAETIPPLKPQRIGVVVNEQTSDDEETQVVVTSLLPDSPADGTLEVDDMITGIGETEINDADSFRRQLITAEADTPLSISVLRAGETRVVDIVPTSVAGEIYAQLPNGWEESGDDEWESQEIKLPDAANEAAYVAPPADSELSQLGLLVVLLGPGQGTPKETLKEWSDPARRAGVVVCVIASEDERRWKPNELDVIANFASAILKKAPISPAAVGVATTSAVHADEVSAADAMALAVALTKSETFFGVAVSPRARPPGMRLTENEPSSALQLLIPVESEDDLPKWVAAIGRAGYPVVYGAAIDRTKLLQWVRLLQAI